ncbi:MAG: ABC transporter ATP-binding protein [Pontibacterium sp.]
MSLFKQLTWFFIEHKKTYLIALFLLSIVALLNVTMPYVIGQIIDLLIEEKALSQPVLMHMAALFAMGLSVYLLRLTWRQMLFGAAYRLGSVLRARFYQRLQALGADFYSKQGTGDLMAKATNDIDAVEVAAGEGVLSGFDGALTFVLVLVMMVSIIDWRLTLVALVPFPLMGYCFYKISIAIHKNFGKALSSFSELNNKTQETLSGIRSVKAMGREPVETQRFNEIADQAAKASYQVARKEALFDPTIYLSMASAMLLTLGYGGYLIINEQLSLGQLASCTLYLVQLIWPMWAFGWLLNIIERGSAAYKRVNQLLNTPDTLPDTGTITHINQGDIKLNQLTFTYNEEAEQPCLKDISLHLSAGKSLGIVGPTGAGKSTLLSLIMRLRETNQRGDITLDGHSLQDFSLDTLRARFAYVPQDSFLFSLSIAENIALANPEASQAEIEEVAKLAALHDDILTFPQGYQTRVGERGLTLSGGQRQRLTIARALLSKAPILVLDDALSAVDVATEQQIIRHLQQRALHQSCIIVCHRLSAVEQLDHIVVLKNGTVSEQGDHASLLNHGGWYHRVWQYQQMEAALNEH